MQNINITVELVDVSERNISDKMLAQKILPTIADIADAEIQIRAGEAHSAGVSSDLVLNVFGPDDAKREAYAAQIIDIINQIPEVQSAVRAQRQFCVEKELGEDHALTKISQLDPSGRVREISRMLGGGKDAAVLASKMLGVNG